MLLLALLVVFKAARVVLIDLQRYAALVAVRFIIAVVEQLRLFRRPSCGGPGRVLGVFALYAVAWLL